MRKKVSSHIVLALACNSAYTYGIQYRTSWGSSYSLAEMTIATRNGLMNSKHT